MRTSVVGFIGFVTCACVALAACDKEASEKPKPVAEAVKEAPKPPPPPPAPAPAPVAVKAAAVPIPAESTKTFNEVCSLCHGKSGKGDGDAAKGMKPPPRNWTDSKWQASVTDEHIAQTLLKGGASVNLSPTMPPSPQLEGKPEVVAGLVQIVRSFNKPE